MIHQTLSVVNHPRAFCYIVGVPPGISIGKSQWSKNRSTSELNLNIYCEIVQLSCIYIYERLCGRKRRSLQLNSHVRQSLPGAPPTTPHSSGKYAVSGSDWRFEETSLSVNWYVRQSLPVAQPIKPTAAKFAISTFSNWWPHDRSSTVLTFKSKVPARFMTKYPGDRSWINAK